MSQEALAAAVGTDRRNIHRWEVQGHDPGGSALLRVLSALGVQLLPAPPASVPRAVNAELRDLQDAIDRVEDAARARHDELLARIDAQDATIRELSGRLADLRSPLT
jgi:hypothetical protein